MTKEETWSVPDSSQDQNRVIRRGVRLSLGRGRAFGPLTGFQMVEAPRQNRRQIYWGSLTIGGCTWLEVCAQKASSLHVVQEASMLCVC